MKGLCILLALCAIHMTQADPLGILENIVNQQRQNTEKVIQDLTAYEARVRSDLETKTNSLKAKGKLDVHDTVESTLDDVRASVLKAREEGIDAEHCYEEARSKLDTVSRNGNAELELCIENAVVHVQPALKNIDATLDTAHKIVTDIDAIIPDCYSSLFVKTQACVLKKVVLMKTSVKRLQSTGRSVKRTASSAYVSTVSSARTCTTRTVKNVRSYSTEIKVNAGGCIRSA